MITFRKDIWKDDEYTYEASYGFMPNIRAYLHEDDEIHDAMLVVPGGGYCMVVPHEGEVVAKNFYDKGMNVFVLTYTTDITFAVPLKLQPLKDISRAMRVLRVNAKDYHINLNKIVICGFSAGGHVCGSLATHWQDIEDEAYADISNRPDGVILSYPVITTGEYTHIYSVWALIGQNASKEEMEYFSLETQVSDKTPPCFIWQTREDDLVPVENSYLFANALREAGVKHAHYVFPYGGHGMSIASADLANGRYCSDYTFEQVALAVNAAKNGKGINVSDERIAELKEQFAEEQVINSTDVGNATNASEWDTVTDEKYEHPHKDVCMWPELAFEWIKSL